MQRFFEQYQANVSKSASFVPAGELPAGPAAAAPVQCLAFYLPQFHRVAENDEWWGAGFTEWTNVTKALPRYDGHLQPRLPADLGFYDLSNADVLRAQAALARRAGISAFCLHDYWFAGRKVLETPLKLILENPDIDISFCLNWANERWSRRWDGSENEVLIEQNYDPDDLVGYVRSILPALRDKRYFRVGARPLIMIYRLDPVPEPRRMFDAWREFLVKEGIGNPYLVMAQSFGTSDPREFGLDAATGFPPHGPDIWSSNERDFQHLFDVDFVGQVHSYSYLANEMLSRFSTDFVTFPGVCPGWDNEARKSRHGVSFYGATPERYGAWLSAAARQVLSGNRPDERLVFINAWNEWAEGAILEPDRHYGHAFLKETRTVLERLRLSSDAIGGTSAIKDATERSLVARATNGFRRRFSSAKRSVFRS